MTATEKMETLKRVFSESEWINWCAPNGGMILFGKDDTLVNISKTKDSLSAWAYNGIIKTQIIDDMVFHTESDVITFYNREKQFSIRLK